MIIAAIILTSERPTKNSAQQKPSASEAEWPCRDDKPNRPSPDFAALINTIAQEGRAYRSEEESEDRGKRFRDWITIGILVATTGGIYWQISEMIKVYGPIKAGADAAQTAAQTASDNVTADNRAWIGPTDVSMKPPTTGHGLEIKIGYTNTGRQPAQLQRGLAFPKFNKSAWGDAQTNAVLNRIKDECMNEKQIAPTTVAYPSGEYQIFQDTSAINLPYRVVVDSDIISGDTIVAVSGCFSYYAFGAVRHSAFCFFYDASIITDISHLGQCDAGNDAD
jgi:hypothetical protein